MKVDFFNTDCSEPSQTTELFGICDDQNASKAYTEANHSHKWIATVKNHNRIELTFKAIDQCMKIYKPETKDLESSCDGMLVFADSIFLIELKNDRGGHGWLKEAEGQLRNTIKLLYENENLDHFRYKKAYACNKKHPSFTVIDNERSKKFFMETTGFRIDVQAEIIIK